jgi:hypothetical protein
MEAVSLKDIGGKRNSDLQERDFFSGLFIWRRRRFGSKERRAGFRAYNWLYYEKINAGKPRK